MILTENIQCNTLDKYYIILEKFMINDNIILNENVSDVIRRIKDFIINKISSINAFFSKVRETIINFVTNRKKAIDEKYKSHNKQNQGNYSSKNESSINNTINEQDEVSYNKKDINIKWSYLKSFISTNTNEIFPHSFIDFINTERREIDNYMDSIDKDLENEILKYISNGEKSNNIVSIMKDNIIKNKIMKYTNNNLSNINQFINDIFTDPTDVNIYDNKNLFDNIIKFIDDGYKNYGYRGVLDTITRTIEPNKEYYNDDNAMNNTLKSIASNIKKDNESEYNINYAMYIGIVAISGASYEILSAFCKILNKRITECMNAYRIMAKNNIV